MLAWDQIGISITHPCAVVDTTFQKLLSTVVVLFDNIVRNKCLFQISGDTVQVCFVLNLE
jgi:hypothetical protein